MVKDRSTWQHLVKEGIKHAENTRNMRQVEKRYTRKAMGPVALPKEVMGPVALPNTISNVKDVRKTVTPQAVFLVTTDAVQ